MAMVSPTSPTLKRAKRFTEMFSPKVMGYHVHHGKKAGHHETHRLAHLPAHLFQHSPR
jgi:hypothetical protein